MCTLLNLGKSRLVKGQVWMVEEDPEVTQILRDNGSKVINGTRPYLILKANDEITTCLPLTSNVTNETRSKNDIFVSAVPHLGIVDSDCRIVMSPTTKSNNMFIKYLYTFDEEAIHYISGMVSHYMFGAPVPSIDSIGIADHMNDKVKEPEDKPCAEIAEKKTLPTCPYERIEYHLTHKKRTEKLFRTPEEGRVWLEFWDGHNTKEIAMHYGISNVTASNWKILARQAANDD